MSLLLWIGTSGSGGGTPIPVITSGTGLYFFKFGSQNAAFSDTIVRPYMSLATTLFPFSVYDLSQGGVNTDGNWWFMISQPFPIIAALYNHPNLQFLIKQAEAFSNQPSIVLNNLPSTTKIANLELTPRSGPTGFIPGGLH